jgi:importin-5
MAPDAGKREIAFRVFTTTPGVIEKQHEEAVAAAFARGFTDDSVAVSELPPGVYVRY